MRREGYMRWRKVVVPRGRGALHPRIAAIRARFGRDTDYTERLIALCGCERHVARHGYLCRLCVKKWKAGGWAALPFNRDGTLKPTPLGR